MKLYIITKDGVPFNGSSSKSETFVKAYFDRRMAEKTAKSFCSAEANEYYRYGDGYYQTEEMNQNDRNELSKKLADEWLSRWSVVIARI